MKRGLIFNKRGNRIVYPTIIFIVLNIAFFSLILIFVSQASNGVLVYEQVYAKEIALALDSSEPGMKIKINFDDGVEIGERNKKKSGFVEIDEKKKEVKIMLGLHGGYAMEYFSNNLFDVSEKLEGKDKYIEVEVLKNE